MVMACTVLTLNMTRIFNTWQFRSKTASAMACCILANTMNVHAYKTMNGTRNGLTIFHTVHWHHHDSWKTQTHSISKGACALLNINEDIFTCHMSVRMRAHTLTVLVLQLLKVTDSNIKTHPSLNKKLHQRDRKRKENLLVRHLTTGTTSNSQNFVVSEYQEHVESFRNVSSIKKMTVCKTQTAMNPTERHSHSSNISK